MIVEIRGYGVLLDSDVAQIYGVETRDINKAVANNPDKFPAGYIVELSKQEKMELVENFHRFERLKHSTVMPTNLYGPGDTGSLSNKLKPSLEPRKLLDRHGLRPRDDNKAVFASTAKQPSQYDKKAVFASTAKQPSQYDKKAVLASTAKQPSQYDNPAQPTRQPRPNQQPA